MTTSEVAAARQEVEQQRAELRQQQQENIRQLWMTRVYQKARNAHGLVLKQCEANEALLSEYAGLPINLAVEAVQKNAGQFVWSNLPASKSDPKQLERDSETLAQAAREYRTFGASEANLALCRDVLGPGFSEYALLQGIRSNAIRLAAPGEEERQRWLEADQDAQKLRLLNTPAHQLKQEAAQGILEAKAKAAQAQADYGYGLRVEAEKHSNFPADA